MVDRPTHDASGEHVKHDAAVELAFSRGVLGDVGDPQPVGFRATECAVNEVRCGDDPRDFLAAARCWKSVDLGSGHEHLDCVVTDLDASTHREFGVDAAGAVGAA